MSLRCRIGPDWFLKNLWKIIKSKKAQKVNQIESILEKVTEIENKQCRVEEELNELEKLHEFLGGKQPKYQKKIKTWLKQTCFKEDKTWINNRSLRFQDQTEKTTEK